MGMPAESTAMSIYAVSVRARVALALVDHKYKCPQPARLLDLAAKKCEHFKLQNYETHL
jgi:hypothetical protein